MKKQESKRKFPTFRILLMYLGLLIILAIRLFYIPSPLEYPTPVPVGDIFVDFMIGLMLLNFIIVVEIVKLM